MMTKKLSFLFFLICIFFSFSLHGLSKDWVLAAEAFEFESYNANSQVVNAFATMFPTRILEKMNTTLYRTVEENELLDRELYELKTNRSSLYLQLSGELKKRDSLVVANYSQKELNEKIAEEEIKIKEIKDKLKENLDRNKEIQLSLMDQNPDGKSTSKNDTKSLSSLIKNIFDEKDSHTLEKISLYKNDASVLYAWTNTQIKKDYHSGEFEKNINSQNIKGLITGKIANFDEFYYVTVVVYSYPGGKEIAYATEIGTIEDVEFMALSVTRQILPSITNSLPVELLFSIDTGSENVGARVSVDDVLYSPVPEKITLQSGVHRIEVEAAGKKTCSTSYFFEGNTSYEISVAMEDLIQKNIRLSLENLYPGSLFANSSAVQLNSQGTGQIQVNGNAILGEFIGDTKGEGAFYYIPENKIENGLEYNLKLKPVNRSDYIEKHRRRMYTSYSILVTSLIPYYYCKGQSNSYITANNINKLDDEQLKIANGWILSSNITTGISIGCGVWFIYELVRYFMAANSALPVQVKSGSFDYKEIENTTIDSENSNEGDL